MITALLQGLKFYWKPLAFLAITLSLIGYIGFLRLQRENISLSFTNYRQAVESAVKEQEMRNSLLKSQSDQRASINEQVYARKIESQQIEIKRLAGDNAGLVNINSGLRSAADSNASTLRSLLKSSEVASSTVRDCNLRIEDANRYIRILKAAAIDTDIKYEACYQGWVDECAIKGCD